MATIFALSINPIIVEGTLWDLIIVANLEKSHLQEGEFPVVYGKVVNHAEKSVSDVKITIKIGDVTVNTETDKDGYFNYEITEFKSVQGHYMSFISAVSPDGRTGFTSLDLDVKGVNIISHTANIINSAEAQFYLNSKLSDFEKDPIGSKLYTYYQIQYEKFLEEEEAIKKINQYQDFLNEQKNIVEEFKQKEIELKKPGAGTYTGRNFNVYVDNLDPSVKGIIKNQLNHTKAMFADAQEAMNQVLKNGGTVGDARKAYFEKASITREQMELLTKPQIKSSSNTTESIPINLEEEEITEQIPVIANYNINGTAANLGNGSTMVSVYVNGTLIQFLLNGTQITPLNNTTQN